jgi:predicted dehydrogenase
VVKSIQSIIESGDIGSVKSVTLSTYRNTHAKGVTEWRTHWRRDHKTSGGGIAMDHGSHTLYLTFDWLKSYPTHVTAHMANLSNGEYDTEDNFSAVLTFPTGIAHVHLTWTAGIRKVIYTLQGENGGIVVDDDDLQIHKQVKTAGPDVAQGNVTWNRKNESISSNWMDASHVSWFNSLLDQFFSAIKNGEHIGKEAKDAFKCIQTIEACYHSAKNGSIQTIVPNSDLK